jgi:hypothetical protein
VMSEGRRVRGLPIIYYESEVYKMNI